MKRIYLYIAISAALAVSCRKADVSDAENSSSGTEQVQSSPIRFSVSDISITKSGISEISDIIGNIRIRGTRGGTVISKEEGKTGYENIGLILDSNTGLWRPDYSPEATWQYEDTEERPEYDENGNPTGRTIPVTVVNNKYSFSAYAFNANVPEGTTGPSVSLITSGDDFGAVLADFTQPEVYVQPADGKPFGYDYVFSERYDVTTSMTNNKVSGDVVKFHMEHALASVNVNLLISKQIYKFKLIGISLSGFYRTANMRCTQARYGNVEGATNSWAVSDLRNLNNNGYKLGSVSGSSADPIAEWTSDGEHDTEVCLLNFCAIPQLLPQDAILKAVFEIQQLETSSQVTKMSQVWELRNYGDWTSGQRNNYTIKVNSTSELVSTFEAWPVVTDINGTILPEL